MLRVARAGLFATLACLVPLAWLGACDDEGSSDGDADVDADSDADSDSDADADHDDDEDEDGPPPSQCDPFEETPCTREGTRCGLRWNTPYDDPYLACVPPGEQQGGEACELGQVIGYDYTDDCAEGLACTDGFCRLLCDPDAGPCEDEAPCFGLEGLEAGVCGDPPEECDVFTSDGCEASQSCFFRTETGATECLTEGTAGPGDDCSADGLCERGSGCYADEAGAACLVYCHLEGEDECDGSQTCQGSIGSDTIGVCADA